MRLSRTFHRAAAIGGTAALTAFAACSEAPTTGSIADPSIATPRATVALTAANVVVAGSDGGAFVNALAANESGYTETEFWDNVSTDGVGCNAGYFAAGTISATCDAEAPGSYANRGGGYSKYWGDGPQLRNTASFMFKGNLAYFVTLKGSYAGQNSEVGWFTVTGGVYTFHEVPGWGGKAVNTTAFIKPAGGQDWGLYIKHADHQSPGCDLEVDCSDAKGDIHGGAAPVQQFALFTNAAESKYLVGIEDNDEEVVGVGDDDFNDFLLEVVPVSGMFVVGDIGDRSVGGVVNFWGAQWLRNNPMSGDISNGASSFKGYASSVAGLCGSTWSSDPGNSAPPPSALTPNVAVIVTSTLSKVGPVLSGDIVRVLIVHHDGNYAPNPGHAGGGEIIQVICPLPQ
jgi:hypothetical protein